VEVSVLALLPAEVPLRLAALRMVAARPVADLPGLA
jgi:hypothetical protein